MNRRRKDATLLGLDVGGQVLDLETAVRDGILGGGGGGGEGGFSSEKLDLKKMIEELESVQVPCVFICPISLEPMRDPVTLCTGQTYERSNILKWFSMGHYTCPTTMQELWDHELTPNATLQHLIHTWFSQKYSSLKKRSQDVHGRAIQVLNTLNNKCKGQSRRIQALKELRQLVSANSSPTLKNSILETLTSLLGPFTTHAVGSEVIAILVTLDVDFSSAKYNLNLTQPAKISLMVDMLNEGSIDTRINCTRLIQMLMQGKDFGSDNVSSWSLLVGLLKLVKNDRHPNGVLAGLRLLNAICSHHESLRTSIVSVGAVPQLVELLPGFKTDCIELALHILELLSKIPEGRLALKDCADKAIPNMVKLLMKVSETSTQLALSILWAVCNLAPVECGALAVDAGLAAKLLLVIQSCYNPVLKQRSAELLKLCSSNYTATNFISKCKLTTTIQ
ncbi:U-box domain-containing protein 75 [Linum grandiflorum]